MILNKETLLTSTRLGRIDDESKLLHPLPKKFVAALTEHAKKEAKKKETEKKESEEKASAAKE